MQEIIIIAGPNGAGKTSFAQKLLALPKADLVFLNADEIARELKTDQLSGKALDARAVRVLRQRQEAHLKNGYNLLLETTLSGRTYAKHIARWREQGCVVRLYFLRLPSVRHSIDRVARRVATGGHDIDVADLERRFDRSLENAMAYKLMVDEFYLFDSLEGRFELIEAWRRNVHQS